MSKALITESLLTGIADAIRAKTGETGTMTPAQMAEKIAAISGGSGSDETARAIVERTITEYTDSEAKKVGNYALAQCSYLESVDLPSVTSLSANAFYYCAKLKKVNLPSLETAESYSFGNCSGLETLDLPALKTINPNVFNSCKALKEINLPSVTYIGIGAFDYCHALEVIDFPSVTNIRGAIFNTTALTEIHFAAANQATIEALSSYKTKFGATNATIYFDL